MIPKVASDDTRKGLVVLFEKKKLCLTEFLGDSKMLYNEQSKNVTLIKVCSL